MSINFAPVIANPIWAGSNSPVFSESDGFTDIISALSDGWGPYNAGQYRRGQVYNPSGATYYVSTSGSDSNAGTSAAPWKTIDHALSTIPTAGNVTIYVAAGTYAENSSSLGYLYLQKAYADWVSVESQSGRNDDVIINQASGSNGVIGVTQYGVCGKIQFKNLTIAPVTTASPTFNVTSSNGGQNSVHFVNCRIAGCISTGAVSAVNFLGDGGFDDFALIDCEFIAPVTISGSVSPYCMSVIPATTAANGKYTNFLMEGCKTADGASYQGFSSNLSAVDGLVVVGNSFTGTSTYGFLVGQDTSSGTAFTEENVYIANNYFASSGGTGHALLIGYGCDSSCVAEYNWCVGTVQGIVVKGASGPTVRRNAVVMTGSGSLNGLYAKASIGARFIENTVDMKYGVAFREDWDSTDSVKSSGTVLQGNRLIADGSSAQLLAWMNTPNCSGGAISDFNVYELRNSAAWGNVRGHTVTSFPDLQSCWAAVGLPGDAASNDANSEQNVSGSADDITFVGTTGLSYYLRLFRLDGQVFTGWAAESGSADSHARGAQAMVESDTAGTYTAPVPPNLPPGKWTVMIYRMDGDRPMVSDPPVSQQALSYAS